MRPVNSFSHLLAIETGILGGSIGYLKNGELLDCLVGRNETSRAEDLILDVSTLLTANDIVLSQIDAIAVSRGPGSYTGVRIGLSSVLGLASATNCPIHGLSLLTAIDSAFEGDNSRLVILPFGKNEFVWQVFNNSARLGNDNTESAVGYLDDLSGLIHDHSGVEILCHSTLIGRLDGLDCETRELSDCLAGYVGKMALARSDESDLTPIYSTNPAKRSSLF